jgi:DNA-binding HxlR family transcriptional regulator
VDGRREDGVTDAEHEALVADVFSAACASRAVLDHVTGRWGALALVALHDGVFRFNALRRRVQGVSEKMLAQTLQALERDGFVHREARPTIPPHVEYSLTPLGRDVAAKLFDLIELLEDRMPEVMAARASHEMRR